VAEALGPLAARMGEALVAAGVRRAALVPWAAAPGVEPVAAYLADKLGARLHAGAGVELVERAELGAILDELALAQTGALDPATTHQAGAVLGVDAILIGTSTLLADSIDVVVRAVRVDRGTVIAVAEASIDRAVLDIEVGTDVRPEAAPPIALAVQVLSEHASGDAAEITIVAEGATLRSGDGLKVAFETNRRAHVYVLLLDSSGKASLLFPGAATGADPEVEGGERVEIPSGDQWFFLDDRVGTETLYVMASLAPLGQIAELLSTLEAMAASPAQDEKVAAFLKGGLAEPPPVTRGIGGVKSGPSTRVKASNGALVERSQELLAGTGALVRAISFEHR
jgi:hypothetical protein